MNKNKSIFLIAPALSMGGMERASVNTAIGLKENGCEVVFLCLFKKEHFFKLDSNIRIIEPKGFNVSTLSILKSISWIRKEVKENQPDRVLVFNKLYGAITALALIGTKYKYFLSERSSPLFEWNFPFNLFNRIAYQLNSPKGVISQTKIAADYQKKYFKKSNLQVIPNSVRDIKLYPNVKRENVILAVGRLNDQLKGFDLLLESFALLINQDWELHIAGGDENGEVLKQQANKLGISSRVKFLGKVKDIDNCYAYAGIYVIPSRSEGFPNALVEAMTAGCCCVAFDFIAGPRDIIIDGVNGFIVENGNVRMLAEKIDAIILDNSLRFKIGERAMDIGSKLDIRLINKKIADFIFSK
jgi:GalNAc-alpha-(1->4)-GalNAc-alpha-(1->3)-diNAcBac-PP-undecaprenol alpha-1,4-N-acetyl-D-galactosaminyltransferase